jgi:hypothetical protein
MIAVNSSLFDYRICTAENSWLLYAKAMSTLQSGAIAMKVCIFLLTNDSKKKSRDGLAQRHTKRKIRLDFREIGAKG